MRHRILATAALIVPCAALVSLSTPAAAGTSCTNLWCQSSQSWSDGGFGSSYDLWSGIETKQDHPGDPAYDTTYIKAGVDFSATAKALGKSRSIAHIAALATNQGGSATVEYWLDAGGSVLAQGSASSTVTYGWDRTFFKADGDIKLLGIHIDLDAEVTGELGVAISPYLEDGLVGVAAEPFVAAYGSVDADVGALCASVGVSGSLTALDLRVPVTMAAAPSPGGIGYLASGKYSLHTLDGKLKVKLEYCGDSKSKTLVNFDGFSTGSTFLSEWGFLPF